MADCSNDKYPGKLTVVEFAIGCPDVVPDEADWLLIGSLRNKELATQWDTIDATTDDSPGAARENIASFQNITLSVDGVSRKTDDTQHNQNALIDHIFNPAATGGQPYAWARVTSPARTYVLPCLWNSATLTWAYDDVSTFAAEAMIAPSDTGVIITPTP